MHVWAGDAIEKILSSALSGGSRNVRYGHVDKLSWQGYSLHFSLLPLHPFVHILDCLSLFLCGAVSYLCIVELDSETFILTLTCDRRHSGLSTSTLESSNSVALAP